MNNYFNKRRFGLLSKNEVISNYKMWSIYLFTIVGIYVGIALLMAILFRLFPGNAEFDPYTLNYMFPGFLFIGGYILTSLTFSEINNKFTSSLWFSVPGSTLEKYMVGAIVSTIGYVVFLIAAFFVSSVISSILTKLIMGFGVEIFNPFTFGTIVDSGVSEYSSDSFGVNLFVLILIYIFTQPMFLVGSIVFKKAAFIKTLLASSVIQTIISFIIGILVIIIIKTGLYENWDMRTFDWVEPYFEQYINADTISPFMFKWVTIIGLPFSLFFNVVGYLKLAEKEVKGGI
ncbi:MAG: hypothetical protein OCD02_20075 [Spirochaetaceae bacterium]